ncbi:MAG: hypothetical protein NT141_04135 [candidate division WWE3 bacterium]|nr:hypothetical protein [candidate division WWE3 bacterium]
MLEVFITSKIRREILAKFLLTPKASFHIRDLGRMVGTEINAVRRELMHLSDAGMLKKRHSGNRLYYETNPGFYYLNPLIKLFSCEYGLGGEILKNRESLGNIKFAMLSLEFIKGRASSRNQVDLMVVGNLNQQALESLVKKEEAFLGKEINFMALSEDEFGFQKTRHDPLLVGALGQARVILCGDEEKYCSFFK